MTTSSGRRLFLVRHGKPLIEPEKSASSWELDPTGFARIEELRGSGRLPEQNARWFSSPEPKALDTVRRLTDLEVTVVDELREHERGPTPWFDDIAEWQTLVRQVFVEPSRPAWPGWEPLTVTRDRVLPVVRRLLSDHPDEDLVLTGHGTAWTMLVAELTGADPDLEAWAALEMPDLWVLPDDSIRDRRPSRRFVSRPSRWDT